jgi:hypothetical protein
MTSAKQKAAARRNIKKAVSAAKQKRTVAHLPKRTRIGRGRRQGSKKEKAPTFYVLETTRAERVQVFSDW